METLYFIYDGEISDRSQQSEIKRENGDEIGKMRYEVGVEKRTMWEKHQTLMQ